MTIPLTRTVLNAYRAAWIRPLRFKEDRMKHEFWNIETDPRIRAFLWSAIVEFPDRPWMITSARRQPLGNGSAHNHDILSAFDIRSKDWSLKQIVEFVNWASFWWTCNPPLIDVVVEDGRYDHKYIKRDKDGKPLSDDDQPWHIHIEVDRPYWRNTYFV